MKGGEEEGMYNILHAILSCASFPGWAGSVMIMLGYLTMSSYHHRVKDGNSLYTLTSWSLFSLLFSSSLSSEIVTRFDDIALVFIVSGTVGEIL